MAKAPERRITRVWRGSGTTVNEACVEWTDINATKLIDKSERDRHLPPATEFHWALDAFKNFIAAPYSLHPNSYRTVVPREVSINHKDDQMYVTLSGQKPAEGFDSPVPFKVPQQLVEGRELAAAVQELIVQANAYIDGARGAADLLDPAE